MRHCCLAAGIMVLLCAGAAWSAGEFVETIPADLPPTGQPAGSEMNWHHGQDYLPGLGFEATVGGWPRLLQRGFLDVLSNRNGNREVYQIAGWQDLGEVRLPGGKVGVPEEVGGTWCYRQFAAGGGGANLRFTVSRLTPAVLFETDAAQVELFAGSKNLGQGPPRTQSVTTAVPGHVAYVSGGRVVTASTGQDLPLNAMDEPWLLFWYGQQSPFFRSSVANLVWKMQPTRDFFAKGHFIPSDLPVLVVFQKRPSALSSGPDALRVQFPGQAGAFTMMPLLGFYHIPAEQTARWSGGLPEDIAQRCRAWARRCGMLPLSCAESRSVSADFSSVTIRQRFTYRALPNEWNLPAERIAPVPPVVGLARQYGFGVSISGELAPHPVATICGPYEAVAGADSVEYTVTGLDRYLKQFARRTGPTGPDASVLAEELAQEVGKMAQAGPLAPGGLFYKRHWQDYIMAEPALTILALAEAIGHLDEPARTAAVEYAFAELERVNPLTTTGVPNYRNVRREHYTVAPLEVAQKHLGSTAAGDGSTSFTQEERSNSLYALWALGQASGRWDALEPLWGQMKSAALSPTRFVEWSTCGYSRGPNEVRGASVPKPGEDRGSIAAVNGQFARWVGMWRLADVFGDRSAQEQAAYWFARAVLHRYAHGRLIEYMYDAKFQTIEAPSDWMLRLSSATGNGGGQGLLWSDRWVDASGDTRTVIRWDEFGPVVSHAFGDHWMPVIPRFLNLVPECGRFVHDWLRDDSEKFVRAVEHNAQAWFLVNRPSNIGKETATDDPRNSYGTFLGLAYALQADGPRLMRYQDIPFYRVGDLYHLRKLTATLWALEGAQWQSIGQ